MDAGDWLHAYDPGAFPAMMRVGAERFMPLRGADPETPIWEQICGRRMARPYVPECREVAWEDELQANGITNDLMWHVMWHLWEDVTVPVCGNRYISKGALRAICLLPPNHAQTVHFAPVPPPGWEQLSEIELTMETALYVWPKRKEQGYGSDNQQRGNRRKRASAPGAR